MAKTHSDIDALLSRLEAARPINGKTTAVIVGIISGIMSSIAVIGTALAAGRQYVITIADLETRTKQTIPKEIHDTEERLNKRVEQEEERRKTAISDVRRDLSTEVLALRATSEGMNRDHLRMFRTIVTNCCPKGLEIGSNMNPIYDPLCAESQPEASLRDPPAH